MKPQNEQKNTFSDPKFNLIYTAFLILIIILGYFYLNSNFYDFGVEIGKALAR